MKNNSLGIELTKVMVLQYSNQETSVTIGESVRDEDGEYCPPCTTIRLMSDAYLW
jgi:phosphoribosylpyrophosphate synthetase